MNKKIVGILLIIGGAISLGGVIYAVFFQSPPTEPAVNDNLEVTEEDEILQKLIEEETARLEAELAAEREKKQQDIINQQQAEQSEGEKTTNNTTTTTKDSSDKHDLEVLASSFAERFGTYSNHSNYENLKNLQNVMSKEMKAWSEDFIEENEGSSSVDDIYYGIETDALTKKTTLFDEKNGKVTVVIDTLRKEIIGTKSNSKTFYQKITINLIKEDGLWKVNSAKWSDK